MLEVVGRTEGEKFPKDEAFARHGHMKLVDRQLLRGMCEKKAPVVQSRFGKRHLGS